MAYGSVCTLRVLMNDWVADDSRELESEHGLSFYVETPESRFLFDCGHTEAAWRNAQKIGVDLSVVQFVVLSHSHYDHAGGFPTLLKHVKQKVIYTGKNFWQEKFSYDKEKDEYTYKGCGFTREDLDSWEVEQFECDSSIRLDNYAALFTGFSRRYDFETIPEKFVRGQDKGPDTFDDEICLLLQEGRGWAMVVGCAHRGILNMVAEVKERTGKDVVRVVGGIHLVGAEDERISRTFKELKAMGVQHFNLCHCSTDGNCKSEAWPADVVPLAGGSTIQVEAKGYMKAAIIYDSRTHTTEKAASFIAEGIHNAGMQPVCFNIDKIDEAGFEYIANSHLVIVGSPTYMASVTAKMKTWLEANWQKMNLGNKLGGAFATEQYIHGGGENVIKELLTFMMVQGMLVYSGGNNYGKPIIHLGPVGMSQDIESFRDLFVTYGERMGYAAVSVM